MGISSKGNDLIELNANADGLSDSMIVMTRHQCKDATTTWLLQRIEEFRATKRMGQHFGGVGAGIVMHNIDQSQSQLKVAAREARCRSGQRE